MARTRQLVGMELIRSYHGLSNQIAIELGIARSAVSRWDQVPHLRAQDIAALTGFRLWQLRPDLWPPPKVRRKPAAKAKRGRNGG